MSSKFRAVKRPALHVAFVLGQQTFGYTCKLFVDVMLLSLNTALSSLMKVKNKEFHTIGTDV